MDLLFLFHYFHISYYSSLYYFEFKLSVNYYGLINSYDFISM